MKYYTVQGLSASGTADKSAFELIGGTAVRAAIRQLDIGFRTNPNATDQQVQVQLGNLTATGTGTAATPKPQDPADVAAVVVAEIAHSAEPTYGSAFFIDTDLNQRASKTWVWEEGREPTSAATAGNGLGCKVKAVTAALVMSAPVCFRE